MNIVSRPPYRRINSTASAIAIVSTLLLGVLVASTDNAVAAPSSQQFSILYDTIVSDGVPQAGAGNLEVVETSDVYRFDATAADDVIFDVLAGDAGVFRWTLVSPSGAVIRNSALFTDLAVRLAESGTYVVTVSGATTATTGTYSFALLRVTPAERFAIGFGDVVSEGVPSAGAGDIERPGAQDRYAFDGVAGQTIVFDHLAGRNVFLGWTLVGPDGSTLFSSFLGDRQVVLPVTGTSALTLRGNGVDDTGTYSFVLLLAPGSELFALAIGDTVSDGVPAAGAGNLEGPGSTDVYSFSGIAGQGVSFEHLGGSNVALGWRLIAPDGTVLFDGFLGDRDVLLPATGAYSLVLRGNGPADSGSYSFRISDSIVNSPPSIDPVLDREDMEGDDVLIELVSSDPDGDALEVNAAGLPLGVVLDPNAQELRGAIETGAANASPYTVTVTVLDPAGASASTTFMWTITAPPIPATTTTIPTTTTTTIPTTTTTTIPTTTTSTTTTTTTTSTTTTTTIPPTSTTIPAPTAIAARVDVVPPRRCIRSDISGVVGVVVYGSPELDVRHIDRASVVLEAMTVVTHHGRPFAFRWDVDRDGFADLVAFIDTVAGGIAESATNATVSGQLDDGTAFAGDDDVCVTAQSCAWRGGHDPGGAPRDRASTDD